MAQEARYTREGEQPITVIYPQNGAAFIAQSCYAFGARKRVTVCRDLNEVFAKTFRTLLTNTAHATNASEYAAGCTRDMADLIMRDMGYTRAEANET